MESFESVDKGITQAEEKKIRSSLNLLLRDQEFKHSIKDLVKSAVKSEYVGDIIVVLGSGHLEAMHSKLSGEIEAVPIISCSLEGFSNKFNEHSKKVELWASLKN
jgi:Asp/Glu/hydantoin racemase